MSENIKRTTMLLDDDVVEALKDRGYNISKLVRNFLKKKLEREKQLEEEND